jgi:hypothetical protein
VGNLFRKPSDSGAKAAERAAAAQRESAERQHAETLRQSERAAAEAAERAAEQARRAAASETLQANLQKLAQEQGAEVAEVVPGGSAEQEQPDQKRKRKMPALSSTLGIEIV